MSSAHASCGGHDIPAAIHSPGHRRAQSPNRASTAPRARKCSPATGSQNRACLNTADPLTPIRPARRAYQVVSSGTQSGAGSLPSSSVNQCPARGHRANGGLAGASVQDSERLTADRAGLRWRVAAAVTRRLRPVVGVAPIPGEPESDTQAGYHSNLELQLRQCQPAYLHH